MSTQHWGLPLIFGMLFEERSGFEIGATGWPMRAAKLMVSAMWLSITLPWTAPEGL